MPQILPGEDEDIARKLEQLLKKRGVNLFTASDAGNFNIDSFERVLVCVGRRPNYEGLGLREIGIELKGDNIALDEYLRTSISNIYAAGDLTGKIMLAHYASFQGELACKNIINKDNPASITQAVVPSCIFTDPEVASCGLREAEAKKAGFDIAVRKFDYLGLGMARVMDECDGLVKLIIDKKTSCLIGASLIGAHSTEIIATLNLAITHGLDLEQLRKCIFAHPTISEAIVEAIG
jgi:dihydrolipoamide dehydrogenase